MRCFNGKPWMHQSQKPDKILNDFARNLDEELIAFRGQLSTAINLAYIMKPKEIRLVGVDLMQEKSFFYDLDTYRFITSYMNDIKEEKGKKE